MEKTPLSPKNDFVFKRLFGEQSRLNLLRVFSSIRLGFAKRGISSAGYR